MHLECQMRVLRLEDISDLRAYEREREAFRSEVIALKRLRRIAIGPLVSVVLENATTVRFQVQEMVRAERILDDERVLEELAAYNPLLPAPGELSMTLLIELRTPEEVREWLGKLVGIERCVLLRIGAGAALVEARGAIDADHGARLTREHVTASVHYAKIALSQAERALFLAERAALAIDHAAYSYEVELSPELKASLERDWLA